MVPSNVFGFSNVTTPHDLRKPRIRYVNVFVLVVVAYVSVLPTVYAVPFGEIHRNIFPLSVARLTRSVLYGRETSPTPSTPAIPTVPLKDVQELSYPNPAVDTVAAIAPVENLQPQEQQQFKSQFTQQQLLISEGTTATPTRSVTPTPIPALDVPVTSQSDNGTTEDSQRSIVVTTDYSTGHQVTETSTGIMQDTSTAIDVTSVLPNMATVGSFQEIQSQQSQHSNNSGQASQTSQTPPPSQESESQTDSFPQTIQRDSNLPPASPEISERSAQRSTSSQNPSSTSEFGPNSEMRSVENVDTNAMSQKNYATAGQNTKNAALPIDARKQNNSIRDFVTSNVASAKETQENGGFEEQAVMTMPPLERRVYSTNLLPGCKKDSPSLLPPGFGGKDAMNKTILDVGAHIGDDYTIRGVTVGHTVIAFEPSPAVVDNFKKYMIQKGMPLSVVNLDHAVAAAAHARNRLVRDAIDGMVVRVLIPRTSRQSGDEGSSMGSRSGGIDMSQARVFLMPFALSNVTGLTKFFESGCKLPHCGKVNRIPMQDVDSVTGNIIVPKYKLDDLILPTDTRKIWFLKVDVEGHELEVLQGARDLIRRSGLEYIVLEFSPNGQSGVQWGVDLLNELFEQGFTCFHMRGFGKCHDDTLRSPSLKCNFPFGLDNPSLAPSFQEYAKVFEIVEEGGKKKPHMADLMCKRRRMEY